MKLDFGKYSLLLSSLAALCVSLALVGSLGYGVFYVLQYLIDGEHWITLTLLALTWSACVLWVYFVAVMRLVMLRQSKTLTPAMRFLGVITLIVGGWLDVLVNATVITLLFLELPRWKEWTVSARVWRLSNDESEGWRYRLAKRFRKHILDNADPRGYHTG